MATCSATDIFFGILIANAIGLAAVFTIEFYHGQISNISKLPTNGFRLARFNAAFISIDACVGLFVTEKTEIIGNNMGLRLLGSD